MTISSRNRPYSAVTLLSIVVVAGALFYAIQGAGPTAIEIREDSQISSRVESGANTEISPELFSENMPPENRDKYLTAIDALDSPIDIGPPDKRYTSNLQAAQAGDPNAQYVVSQALQQCSEVPGQKRMEEIRADDGLAPIVKSAIELKFSACVDLRALVSEDEIRAGKDAWLEMSASQGHALASIRLSLFEELDPTVDRRTMFIDALKLRSPDIYELMTFYHAKHNTSDPAEWQAWSVHKCNHDSNCSPEEVLSNIMNGMLEHEATAIVDRVIEIRSALDSENWELLTPSF